MTARLGPALALLLVVAAPVLGGDLADTLARREFDEAVAQAESPDQLYEAVVATRDVAIARAVARAAIAGKGPFADRAATASWIETLAAAFDDDCATLIHAGYVRLAAGQPKLAARTFARAAKRAKNRATRAQAATYLAHALEEANELDRAIAALELAALSGPARNRFRSQVGRRIARRLQAAHDARWIDVLELVGEPLLAAESLALELPGVADPKRRAALTARARRLFAAGLTPASPARAWWAAACVAGGEDRFHYLIETVKREEHPAALVALARACAKRGRPVAAADLAERRLRIGDCPAAWEVLEELPPEYAR